MTNIRLFISHASEDREIAAGVVELLRAALVLPSKAIRCTSVDGYRLPGGANTNEQLRQEVYEADAFAGIVSTNSLRSMYVLFELGARWGAQRHLIPLLAPGTSASVLDGPLAGLNALSLDNTAQIHQLVADMGAVLSIVPDGPASYQRHLEALVRASSTQDAEIGTSGHHSHIAIDSPVKPPVALSEAAAELLLQAGHDRRGSVLVTITHNSGLSVQTNEHNFVEAGNSRSEARWRCAVNDLVAHGFLADRGYNGEEFRVTDDGYKIIDTITQSR